MAYKNRIFVWQKDGTWKQVTKPEHPERPNFLIVCEYGDWSGFRTLAECLKQNPGEGMDRPDGFYWVEER